MTANAARSSSTPMVVFFLSITKEVGSGRSDGNSFATRSGTARRNGIETARMQRRAFHEADRREDSTGDCAMRPHGLGGIMRATRRKTAAARGAKNHGQNR